MCHDIHWSVGVNLTAATKRLKMASAVFNKTQLKASLLPPLPPTPWPPLHPSYPPSENRPMSQTPTTTKTWVSPTTATRTCQPRPYGESLSSIFRAFSFIQWATDKDSA